MRPCGSRFTTCGDSKRVRARTPAVVAHLDRQGQGGSEAALGVPTVCIAARFARGAFFRRAFSASHGAIECTWPRRCVYGYKQTCVRTSRVYTSGAQRCNEACVRACSTFGLHVRMLLQGQSHSVLRKILILVQRTARVCIPVRNYAGSTRCD